MIPALLVGGVTGWLVTLVAGPVLGTIAGVLVGVSVLRTC